MIDTIVLSIPQGKFQIRDHKKFNPSTEGFFSHPYISMGGKPFIKAVQNPPKSALENGLYLPRLTLIKALRRDGPVMELKVELSLPKLFFGNNFDELEDHNFLRVVRLLNRALHKMDVLVEFGDLEYASISSIHYSKNIYLKNGVSCSMILNELKKIDLSKRIDNGEETFKNGGVALHYHTNSWDLCFYDKVKDLEQAKTSDKRSMEKDNTLQMSLFDDISNFPKKQVLRMEIRLGNRTKIKALLKQLKIEKDLVFRDLFSTEISKKNLLYFWAKIKEKSVFLQFKTEGLVDLADSIKANNPNLKSKKIFEIIGFLAFAKEGGTKRARNFLGHEGSLKENRKWYELQKLLKTIKYDKRGSYQAMDEFGYELEVFRQTKLEDLGETLDKDSVKKFAESIKAKKEDERLKLQEEKNKQKLIAKIKEEHVGMSYIELQKIIKADETKKILLPPKCIRS